MRESNSVLLIFYLEAVTTIDHCVLDDKCIRTYKIQHKKQNKQKPIVCSVTKGVKQKYLLCISV